MGRAEQRVQHVKLIANKITDVYRQKNGKSNLGYIVSALNAAGMKTGGGNDWNRDRLSSFLFYNTNIRVSGLTEYDRKKENKNRLRNIDGLEYLISRPGCPIVRKCARNTIKSLRLAMS